MDLPVRNAFNAIVHISLMDKTVSSVIPHAPSALVPPQIPAVIVLHLFIYMIPLVLIVQDQLVFSKSKLQTISMATAPFLVNPTNISMMMALAQQSAILVSTLPSTLLTIRISVIFHAPIIKSSSMILNVKPRPVTIL